MPYLKIVKKKHECVLPTSIHGHKGSRGVTIGTVWACPICDIQWEIAKDNEDKLFWRKLRAIEQLPNPYAKKKKRGA